MGPADEACNGEDDDCDGNTDEGFADRPDVPDDNFEDSNCDGIDGTRSAAIFVSPQGDDQAAGTLDAPMATLARAMLRAEAENKYVIAANGVYEGTLALISGVNVYGGAEAADGGARRQ